MLLHIFPLATLDESVTLPPWQKVVGPLAAMTGAGLLFTVTLTGVEEPVQPLASVTATE